MHPNPIKKYRLLIFGSWLVARLWWSFEISRLMFLRFIPGAQITRVQTRFSPGQWIYDSPRLYKLMYDREQDQIIFHFIGEITES